LGLNDLRQLASEIREEIIRGVARTGGHLASNLGVVELTTALYAVYDPPKDVIIWDVGHQCYAHKMLTGRYRDFRTLRQFGGISGFPKRSESPYDAFGTGHASTSISAALGFAKARDLRGGRHHVVAVIGDGALTGGLAWEALNNAGQIKTNLTVVLNDNEMSIARNVGALATHLSKLRMLPLYRKVENRAKEVIESLPMGGKAISRTAEGILHGVTHLIAAQTGIVFEEMGFTYLGPIDGHDIELLVEVFKNVRRLEGPVLVHVLTRKGKGYEKAENNARVFHGVAPNGSDQNGKVGNLRSFTDEFADAILDLARDDDRVVAVTAAMPDGTGLNKFAEEFPARFYDVGIAEQHAVTFAAGLAAGGLRPVVAIYSTFLQRAYDQIVHDVCLQRLPVIFAIDRAGLVGEDGPTHHGAFDVSYLRHIPNLSLAAPADASDLRSMLKLAIKHDGPFAIRYPRSPCPAFSFGTHGLAGGIAETTGREVSLGKSEVLADGDDVVIIAVGPLAWVSMKAREILRESGVSATVVNARFIKPLDSALITRLARQCPRFVLVEENATQGGFGSAVLELLAGSGISDVRVRQIGLPDEFATHGAVPILAELYGLDAEHIAGVAMELINCDSSMRPSGEVGSIRSEGQFE